MVYVPQQSEIWNHLPSAMIGHLMIRRLIEPSPPTRRIRQLSFLRHTYSDCSTEPQKSNIRDLLVSARIRRVIGVYIYVCAHACQATNLRISYVFVTPQDSHPCLRPVVQSPTKFIEFPEVPSPRYPDKAQCLRPHSQRQHCQLLSASDRRYERACFSIFYLRW